MAIRSVSPSRRYVAMRSKPEGRGLCFRFFELPDHERNDSDNALSYYLNQLDDSATVFYCVTFEDYLDSAPEDGLPRNYAEVEVTTPEYDAGSDAHFDVAFDVRCMGQRLDDPDMRLHINRHVETNVKRRSPGKEADYAGRYETAYRERYAFWLAMHAVYGPKDGVTAGHSQPLT